MKVLFPVASFVEIELSLANRKLVEWGHLIGEINRPMNGTVVSGGGDTAHALVFGDEIVAVTVMSTLIRMNVAGRRDLNRANTVELSRLCACRPNLCRVALRLWREAVFLPLADRFEWAISYQDANCHTGNTYRFDGWRKLGTSRSGNDRRSGRRGRRKVIWGYQQPQLAGV